MFAFIIAYLLYFKSEAHIIRIKHKQNTEFVFSTDDMNLALKI